MFLSNHHSRWASFDPSAMRKPSTGGFGEENTVGVRCHPPARPHTAACVGTSRCASRPPFTAGCGVTPAHTPTAACGGTYIALGSGITEDRRSSLFWYHLASFPAGGPDPDRSAETALGLVLAERGRGGFGGGAGRGPRRGDFGPGVGSRGRGFGVEVRRVRVNANSNMVVHRRKDPTTERSLQFGRSGCWMNQMTQMTQGSICYARVAATARPSCRRSLNGATAFSNLCCVVRLAHEPAACGGTSPASGATRRGGCSRSLTPYEERTRVE